MQKRQIASSRELATKMTLAKVSRVWVYSFFPIDPIDSPAQKMIHDWKEKLSIMPSQLKDAEIAKTEFLVSPKSHVGMKRYEIRCKNCNEIQGYTWAPNNKLEDWSDLHYTNWTDGVEWRGCLTVNVSPISGLLGFECTCGYDTRDFRANMTLPSVIALEKEKSNNVGRLFGRSDSKFQAVPVPNNVDVIDRYSKLIKGTWLHKMPLKTKF